MADYRPVKCSIWTDPDFQNLTPNEKLIFLNLMTNKQTTESGIYPVSFRTISFETGIDEKEVGEILSENRLKNIGYDIENKCVFVKNFRKHNRSGRPDFVGRSITKDYCSTQASQLWELFKKEYPELSDLLTTDMKPIASKPKAKGKKRKGNKKSPPLIFSEEKVDALIDHYNILFNRTSGQNENSRATMQDRLEKFAAALIERRKNQGIELTPDNLFDICRNLQLAVYDWPSQLPNKWENIYRHGVDRTTGEDCLTKRMETHDRYIAGDKQENEKPAADYQKDILFNQEENDEQE